MSPTNRLNLNNDFAYVCGRQVLQPNWNYGQHPNIFILSKYTSSIIEKIYLSCI